MGKIVSGLSAHWERPKKYIQNLLGNKSLLVYGERGEKYLVSQKVWRKKILPKHFEDHWHHPELLYSHIILALKDGLYPEALKASRRLKEIDPNKERATVTLGIALLKNRLFKEARHLFEDYLSKEKKSGTVLVNLAKVYSYEKKEQKSKETLEEALQLDPNQENGLRWYMALLKVEGGDFLVWFKLKDLAKISGSWLAHYFLAEECFRANIREEGMSYIEKALYIGGYSGEILYLVSQLFLKRGEYGAMLSMVRPFYKIGVHNHEIGYAILEASAERGDYNEGEVLLTQLATQLVGHSDHLDLGVRNELAKFSEKFQQSRRRIILESN